MNNQLKFDEGTSRRVEATYATADVIAQRRMVLNALGLGPGERVLDIGSGPGFLVSEMADAVGAAGTVTGVDTSESMLAMGRSRPLQPGSAQIGFLGGEATALPFAGGSFDAVTSTQVYEYVQDVQKALGEARRILRPGGRLLVLDTDWDSIVWRCTDKELMQRVLAAWAEHLADAHLPQRLSGLLEVAGFRIIHRAVIPVLNTGYEPDTYSAGLVDFIATFVPGRQGVTSHDAANWVKDVSGQDREYFFSLNRYLFIATSD